MLEMENALRAKRTLDDWLEANRVAPLTGEEAQAVEAVMTSPVGSRACQNLRDVLWLVRDLVRSGTGDLPAAMSPEEIEAALLELDERRASRGTAHPQDHRRTAEAILSSPIGQRARSSIARLDAAVTLLWRIQSRPKKDDGK